MPCQVESKVQSPEAKVHVGCHRKDESRSPQTHHAKCRGAAPSRVQVQSPESKVHVGCHRKEESRSPQTRHAKCRHAQEFLIPTPARKANLIPQAIWLIPQFRGWGIKERPERGTGPRSQNKGISNDGWWWGGPLASVQCASPIPPTNNDGPPDSRFQK